MATAVIASQVTGIQGEGETTYHSFQTGTESGSACHAVSPSWPVSKPSGHAHLDCPLSIWEHRETMERKEKKGKGLTRQAKVHFRRSEWLDGLQNGRVGGQTYPIEFDPGRRTDARTR